MIVWNRDVSLRCLRLPLRGSIRSYIPGAVVARILSSPEDAFVRRAVLNGLSAVERSYVRRIGVVSAVVFANAVVAAPSGAIPPDDQFAAHTCVRNAKIAIRIDVLGLPAAGTFVQLSSKKSKVVIQEEDCDVVYFALPSVAWQLERKPAGSAASVKSSGDAALVALPLDVEGEYGVRFTGCPLGCMVGGLAVPTTTQLRRLIATGTIVRPPETQPSLPPSSLLPTAPVASDAAVKCTPDGGGIDDPQWVVVEPWSGPVSYRSIQGYVAAAHISSQDNYLNHNGDQHDINIFVRPDPRDQSIFWDRIRGEPLEVEWQEDKVPLDVRPVAGDRLAVFGYWIHDCGHDFHTEIHPPVGMAVQKPRPVQIPAEEAFAFAGTSASVGTGVYVPGIVTSVFFNSNAGEILECSNDTTLHQAAIFTKFDNGTTGYVTGPCIRGPAPLNRTFEFDINVPRDMRSVFEQAGIPGKPDVPLFLKVTGTGPNPSIQLRREGGVPYLHVKINTSGYQTFRRTITAAWVYPSPDNWNLKRWRVQINDLIVRERGDYWTRGDWRLYTQTNNTTTEWTELIHCTNCISDGRLATALNRGKAAQAPWQTGPTGILGPDILAFPGQYLWFEAFGFDKDMVWDDNAGRVGGTHPQEDAQYQDFSCCTGGFFDQACCSASYAVAYQLFRVNEPPQPVLSDAAASFFSAYRLTTDDLLSHDLPQPVGPTDVNPADIELIPDGPPLRRSSSLTYEPQECEDSAFPCISTSRLQRVLHEMGKTRRGRVKLVNFLSGTRSHVAEAKRRGDEVDLEAFEFAVLPIVRKEVQPALYRKHFASIIPPTHATIRVTDAKLDPVLIDVEQGARVEWRFNVRQPQSVLDASGLTLFDSPERRRGTSYTFPFMAAGSYRYVVRGSSRKGVVRVPIRLVKKRVGLYRVEWSRVPPPVGMRFEVQIQPPGSATYTSWKPKTDALAADIPLRTGGTYAVRARLRSTVGKRALGWSPTLLINVP
jgi:hypothetical protein